MSGAEPPIDWRHCLPDYGPKQLSRNAMKEARKNVVKAYLPREAGTLKVCDDRNLAWETNCDTPLEYVNGV